MSPPNHCISPVFVMLKAAESLEEMLRTKEKMSLIEILLISSAIDRIYFRLKVLEN
jgi:hypothetical protein